MKNSRMTLTARGQYLTEVKINVPSSTVISYSNDTVSVILFAMLNMHESIMPAITVLHQGR